MTAANRRARVSPIPGTRRARVVRANVVADGKAELRAPANQLQVDRLHPSFRVTRASGNALWRRRVDPPQIALG